jgi:hypothetical protein
MLVHFDAAVMTSRLTAATSSLTEKGCAARCYFPVERSSSLAQQLPLIAFDLALPGRRRPT